MRGKMKVLNIIRDVLLGILLALLVFAGAFYWVKLPAIQVAKGIAALVQETESYENPVLEDVNWPALADRVILEGAHVHLEGSASALDQEKETFGLDTDILLDRAEKELFLTTNSRLFGWDMGTMELSGDENNLYFAVPDLLEETFRIGTQDFGEKYQDSLWADWLKWEVEPDMKLNLFPDWGNGRLEEAVSLWKERLETVKGLIGHPYLVALGLKAKRTEEKNVYLLTLPGEWVATGMEKFKGEILDGVYGTTLQELWETLAQEEARALANSGEGNAATPRADAEVGDSDAGDANAGEVNAEDINLLVSLDAQGKIVKLVTARGIRMEDSPVIYLEMELSGTERALDALALSLTLEGGDEVAAMTAERKAEPEEDGGSEQWKIEWAGDWPALEDGSPNQGTLALDDSWKYSDKAFSLKFTSTRPGEDAKEIGAEGSFRDVVPGESATLQMDSLTFPFLGTQTVEVSGTLSLEPLRTEITLPQGGEDFLGMGLEEMGIILLKVLF